MSELFGVIALAFFPLIVICAGIADFTTMRIPNRLSAALLLGYILFAPLVGFPLSQMALDLTAASIVFCLGFGAFALGGMGGGDVKLMAVAALWLGLPQMAAFLLWTAVSGAVLILALLAYWSFLPQQAFLRFGWASRLNTGETRVPYGVAIASASLIVFTSSPWMALR